MNQPGHKILLITLLYAIGASLWILCSDLVIAYLIDDPAALVIASTAKGWGFVAVTALLLYLLQKRFTVQAPADDTGTHTAPERAGRALYPAVIVAIASIVLVGAFSIQRLTEENARHTVEQLQAIATLKAEQIGHWLEERARYAELVSTHSSLGGMLQRWRRDGGGESRDDVLQQLVYLRRLTGFQALFVIDRSGRFLIGDGSEQHTPAILSAAIERAFSSGLIQNTGFYREGPGPAGDLHLDFVAVIADAPELALILRLDESSFPFPFLQEWPVPSASAETLLFKADGDGVLFLNELRHRHDTALKLRVPFDSETVLAVQLATGRAATGEPIYGTDYRGEPVMGVARSIHGTPWFLIAKIDRKEADAEQYTELALLGLALFLALLAVVAGALLLRQRKQLHAATERQRDLAESSLDIVFLALPDLYFRMEANGTILDYRAQRTDNLYIPPEKFLGRRMQDVLPPELGGAFKAEMDAVCDTGELTTFEYSLAMPQGEQYYEARLARLPDKSQLIAIVRDISERRRMLRKLDNISRMYATLSQVNQAILRQPDRRRLFQEICDIAVEYGRFRLAWIGLVDDQRTKVEVVASSGEATDYVRDIDISLSGDANANGPTGRAIRDGDSVVFNDLEHNPEFLPWRELALQQGLRSSGAFPLRLGENVIGALNVYAAESDYFNAEEIGLLHEATQDISFALDKASEERIRRRTEQALRDSEAHLRTLIDSLPDLVWLKNPDGVYQFCNTRFARFFGAKAAEIVGGTDYDFVDRELADIFRDRDRAAMAVGGPSTNEEEITFADDGHRELVETVMIPMIGDDGALLGVLGIARDITERKRQETYMSHYAERAEALLKLPRMAEEFDENGFLQRGLELAEDLTGSEISFLHFVNEDEESIELVAWSRRTLVHYCHVIHDTHYPVREAGIWADALRRREPVLFNDYAAYPDKRGLPDGHAELKRLISVPVIENGKVVMLVGVGNRADDYTALDAETVQLVANEIRSSVQRRRFVATLRAKEARYRELVDNMSAGVAVYEAVDDGRDFVFREHNSAGERITGMTREQTIGRRVTEVFTGVGDMGLLDVFRRVWRTGDPEAVPARVYQDNRVKLWLDNYVFKLPSGELVAVYDDITRRMQTEDALRESESRLRTLIDTLPDLVWLKDPEGVFLACNPKFERLYGASEAEIVGRTDYDFTDEAQAGFFRDHDRAAMAAGGPSTNEEQLTYADDGHTELVETVKTPMYNTDGELIGVLGIGRDITDHIRAETELAAQLTELQRWRDVTLERELRGLELKREINILLWELGRPPRYPSALQQGEHDD